ncbi:hypothetical protein VIGAN_08067100 [Vigna angularis var. angularis]|uniref:Uncharacterized protein n=1 Tax=Vigna angularis var. angularis TaxID=157739 RepID=A0A0S3SMM3_PHAAN|nr:hypothetical protein VIGAN_08067100 [Vigna angularis var. angularis]
MTRLDVYIFFFVHKTPYDRYLLELIILKTHRKDKSDWTDIKDEPQGLILRHHQQPSLQIRPNKSFHRRVAFPRLV